MIVGQKVGYARVSKNAQDLGIQREKLADCDRICKSSEWAAALLPKLNLLLVKNRSARPIFLSKSDFLVFEAIQKRLFHLQDAPKSCPRGE